MSQITEYAKKSMTFPEFESEVLEAFAVIQIMRMENNDAKTGMLVFNNLKVTLELTDE
ncbi:MAG: hypothetical protein ACSHXL_00480 [Bacteroidota bacterium]